jgi:Lrp/AsnC family transcriptional regulator, leucine-responsive regulatory protein
LKETTKHMDRLDRNLLAALVRDGRATTVELSDAVHLSPTAVARRQRALEEAGVIRGYTASLNPAAFGVTTTVVVHIALSSQREADLSSFEEAVRHCDSVVQCLLMSGTDDYLLILQVRDLADYERVHKMQLSRLPNVARIQSSFALREIVKRAVPADLLD